MRKLIKEAARELSMMRMNRTPPHAMKATGLTACAATLAAAAASLAGAAATDPVADLVLLHGRIHTEDPSHSVAQALALRGNTIVAVGTDEAVNGLIGPGTRILDLLGRVVLPGFIDAHTHPAESAQEFGKCTLEDKKLTAAKIRASAKRGFFIGRSLL